MNRPRRKKPIQQVQEWCRSKGMPESIIDSIPSDYIRYESTLIFRFPKDFPVQYESIVGEAWVKALDVKTVLKISGIVSGSYRLPGMTRIFGPGGDVIHWENGIRFRFDPEKILFSPGNHLERMRMAEIDMNGETVVDLFAGIGYFSIPAALHGGARHVYSCELNPVSYGYLLENIRLNHVDCIIPLEGNNGDVAPLNIADRVIMGYVGTTHDYLPVAFRCLKDSGIIHYHEVCPINLLPDRPIQRVREAARDCGGLGIEFMEQVRVKSYGPKTDHVVLDILVTRK